ncbi:hypothetical protein J4771_00600 [Candidatus Kaistella beijingensis]|uniref:hypothetical protein n=1 Tax=Candidatus Kaistella beijingensis TaxID=2820270 RepID=UPI001CC5EFD5|nr:hypothetical protein [Candidatus Kaistella beijingensis]UBB89884.1 hypothetical protein J4771_00600 [Candidatus Kaistella beijingensis]
MFNFFKNKKNKSFTSAEKSTAEEIPAEIIHTSDIMEDHGGKYYLIQYWGKEERRTHISGILKGKYRGFYDYEDTHSKYFRFEIYESQITNVEKLEFEPNYEKSKFFPKDKLPELLSTSLKNGSDQYQINIHDPQFTDQRKISQKLQQTDGNESFGVIEGEIFGYVKDEVDAVVEKKIYITEPDICKPTLEPTGNQEIKENCIRKEYWCECKTKTYWGNWECEELVKSDIKTGNIERSGNFFREEYWYEGKKHKYWGDWKTKTVTESSSSYGCGTILWLILGIILLIIFAPYLLYIVPFLIIWLIIKFLQGIFKYIFPILAILLLIGLFSGVFRGISEANNPIPVKIIKDDSLEKSVVEKIENKKEPNKPDSIITHFRKWKDYKGNIYEGKYSLKLNDIRQAHQLKRQLPQDNYAYFIHSLKENDRSKIENLYTLFDGIRADKKLNNDQFADVIVSFVQDIPYALVLDNACDPNLYSEKYIKDYFAGASASCDPNQALGINSPVEFLANLKGDCDTRTLLIYTILDHYGYEVLLLTSQIYQHSIIAVYKNSNAIKFNYFGKNYTVWETTSFQEAGILPLEISNQNYWDVTLKSKNNGQ